MENDKPEDDTNNFLKILDWNKVPIQNRAKAILKAINMRMAAKAAYNKMKVEEERKKQDEIK
jgi:hypothetical protein